MTPVSIDAIAPPRLELARTPTPLEFLTHTSREMGVDIYVKRDDYTGMELSGNKIRKLEFILADAIASGADTIITCGGAQSNHARATAIAAAKLGRHLLAKTVFIQHKGLLHADTVMAQQFFKSGIQWDKDRCLPGIHALLSAGHNFVEAIEDKGQTFALHEKLVDLVEFVVGKLFCGSCDDQTV